MAERLDKSGLARLWQAIQMKISEMPDTRSDFKIKDLSSGVDIDTLNTPGKFFVRYSDISSNNVDGTFPSNLDGLDFILENNIYEQDEWKKQMFHSISSNPNASVLIYTRTISFDGLTSSGWVQIFTNSLGS